MTAVQDSAGASSRRIAGAVGVQLTGRIVGSGASVLAVALTTRRLGLESYGLLTTAVVFVALWTSLTELGIGPVIVRAVTDGRGELSRLVGINVALSAAYCVPLAMISAVSGLLVYHARPELRGLLIVVSAGLVLQTMSSCFDPVFLVRVRLAAAALGDVAARVANLVATVVVIELHGGLIWFGVATVAPPLVTLLVKATAAARLVRVRPVFDRAAAGRLLRESLPQTGVLIIGVLYWRADAVILTLLSGPRQVGAYGIAYTAAFTLSVVASFYLASSLSTMTGMFGTDRAAFARFVENGVQTMLFLGLPLVVVGGVLARPLITVLGSSRFAAAAALPFALLLGAAALTFVTGALGQALFAAHDQVFLLRLNIVNLAVNIVLNLVLVPIFGATGAALALLVSELSGAAVSTWRLSGRCGYRTPWRFLAWLLVPLGSAALIALAARHVEVLAAAVATGIAYLVVNLAVGPVRASTVRSLLGRT